MLLPLCVYLDEIVTLKIFFAASHSLSHNESLQRYQPRSQEALKICKILETVCADHR